MFSEYELKIRQKNNKETVDTINKMVNWHNEQVEKGNILWRISGNRLSELTGIPQKTVNRLMRGINVPSEENFNKIAGFFNQERKDCEEGRCRNETYSEAKERYQTIRLKEEENKPEKIEKHRREIADPYEHADFWDDEEFWQWMEEMEEDSQGQFEEMEKELDAEAEKMAKERLDEFSTFTPDAQERMVRFFNALSSVDENDIKFLRDFYSKSDKERIKIERQLEKVPESRYLMAALNGEEIDDEELHYTGYDEIHEAYVRYFSEEVSYFRDAAINFSFHGKLHNAMLSDGTYVKRVNNKRVNEFYHRLLRMAQDKVYEYYVTAAFINPIDTFPVMADYGWEGFYLLYLKRRAVWAGVRDLNEFEEKVYNYMTIK